ncbi:MAG: nitrilase-related carbon-nitrogen hydrolase, partial [Cloacibacillus sp.]
MNDKKQFRTALLQIPVALGDRRANMESVEGWFKEYYKPSEMTTAVVLPELWDTGYALDVVPQVADKNAAQTTDFLGRLAKQYGCWFTGGSVMAEENGKFYNRSLIVNPAGELVTHYDKVHLVPFITVEDGVFEHGEKPCIFDMDGITCGSIICYDIRFPEWIRVYALKGVEALFICSQWTRSRMDLYRT